MTAQKQQMANPLGQHLPLICGGAVLLGMWAWVYWEPVAALVERWASDPDYQYGFLVPVFAAYLLWHRRAMRPQPPVKGSLWGLAFLGLAGATLWASTYFLLALPKPLSIVPCLIGSVLLVGGWASLRWTWPSIVFLAFMVPLPGFLGGLLSQPLQRVGTLSGTAVIQTLGIPAAAQGNVILLAEAEIGVVEACSGLRMLMLFITVCVGTAFLVQRTWLERVVILLSAIPIAIAANVARISVTAVLHAVATSELANAVFHDVAGWFMMPLAIVMLLMLMALLSKLLVDAEAAGPVALGMSRGHGPHNDRPSGKLPMRGKRPSPSALAARSTASERGRVN